MIRRTYGRQPHKQHFQPTYNVIVNPAAHDYSKAKIQFLKSELERKQFRYFITEPDSTRTTILYIRNVLRRSPYGIIVCGGDGSVNLVGRYLIRRRTGLGIIPLGKFNNIYSSIYGDPDLKTAVEHATSGKDIKIDCAMASGHFFVGSLGFGLMPELAESLEKRRPPRFAISWSRLAAQAAASTTIEPLSLKIDAFKFDVTPQMLNINLLCRTAGLSLVPATIYDDGKCEITFDVGGGKAIISSYIRQIFKKKYIYGDQIRMFRGEKISIAPVEGRKIYIDGEIMEFPGSELNVEILSKKIRVFHKVPGQKDQ
jgi:diacylglycerol kinase family enzyme